MEGGITSLSASQGGNFCTARSSKERERTVSADVAVQAIWDELTYRLDSEITGIFVDPAMLQMHDSNQFGESCTGNSF